MKLEKLRNLSHFMNTTKVLKDGKEKLIVHARSSENLEDYFLHNYCLGFYCTSALWTHSNSCEFKKKSVETSKGNAVLSKPL